ncbi:MAG: arginine--tRNA ligase [Desulfobacterales bacterium]
MKQKLQKLIAAAVRNAFEDLDPADIPPITIEVPKYDTHGDFSTNFAMVSASAFKSAPKRIAEAVVAGIPDTEGLLEKVEIAGPGFINFFINASAWHAVLKTIHAQKETYGSVDIGKNERVQVEFVSANPTGPLHVGHGRGAAVGDAVARILSFCGYDVHREYYINDSGRQITTLGRSVYLRYESLFGIDRTFPENCYQGSYIIEIAKMIRASSGDALLKMDENDAVNKCARFAAAHILDGIKTDLNHFGVRYNTWFSEQTLYDDGKIDQALNASKQKGLVYEKDGAWWFRTSSFGDEKDRVVVRSNGETTYFASDIAYHEDKFCRGFSRIIDVWGADHHGYIPRMRACITASGHETDAFGIILVQLVNLLRKGEPVAMSTRAGEFVTLKDVMEEVGSDAARFIFLTRHHESPLEFDLEIAKKKTNENPVYYVQYVHARISSIIRNAVERGYGDIDCDPGDLAGLTAVEETALIKMMDGYPETVKNSAELLEPHRITFYLITLASAFHAYYNKHRVLSDNAPLTRGRLYLVSAVNQVIRNGLTLLGVSAPEHM